MPDAPGLMLVILRTYFSLFDFFCHLVLVLCDSNVGHHNIDGVAVLTGYRQSEGRGDVDVSRLEGGGRPFDLVLENDFIAVVRDLGTAVVETESDRVSTVHRIFELGVTRSRISG